MRTYTIHKILFATFAVMIFLGCGCVLSSEDEAPRGRVYSVCPPDTTRTEWSLSHGVWVPDPVLRVRAFLDEAPRRIREPVWIEWDAPKDWYAIGREQIHCGLLVDVDADFVFIAMHQNVETDSTSNREAVPIVYITDAYYLKRGDDLPGVPR